MYGVIWLVVVAGYGVDRYLAEAPFDVSAWRVLGLTTVFFLVIVFVVEKAVDS